MYFYFCIYYQNLFKIFSSDFWNDNRLRYTILMFVSIVSRVHRLHEPRAYLGAASYGQA